MAQLPRGVPFIDLLVPQGTAVQVAELQTRLDLVTGGGWRILADDGTFEDSSLPSQPVRGKLDRIWVYRAQPLVQGDNLEMAASIAVELALLSQARLAAVGVWGLFAWSFVLFEDLRWLHGLLLLDWLYNPRLDARGEIVEEPNPADDAATVTAKLGAFQALWTPEAAVQLGRALPAGVVQPVETHHALSLLGPDGGFDPRYWQSLSMQLVLPQVRAWAAKAPGAPPAPPPKAPEPSLPDDGLTPLARAAQEAAERARVAAEEGPGEEPEEALAGAPVRWADGPRGPVLWLPPDRYEPGLLRQLRAGSLDGVGRSERPSGEVLERWMGAGTPFVTEVPFLSRLFLDDKPLHNAGFAAAAEAVDGLDTVVCHLPRVARVRAVIVPAEGAAARRILVASDPELGPAQIKAIAAS
jgi:hypothetical protein